MARKRLTIFVEGDTDKLFFDLLISFLFDNTRKKKWDKSILSIVSLDGICNAESIIENTIYYLENKEKYEDTVCLIYDTDAFEYQKKPPISIERVKRIVEQNKCDYFDIPVTHNVEDMITFSMNEIKEYLKIPKDYVLPSGLSGLGILKRLHKEAGTFYIKGNKSEGLLKCLDYSSISKKYCKSLKRLCDYLELGCNGRFCKIKRK